MRSFTTGALIVGLLLTGCTVGSGELVTESRSVSGFSRIELAGSGEVRISIDGTESLEIEAEDNVMDRLVSRVSGGTLVLDVDGPIQPREDIVYTVTMRSLDGVQITGSGSVTVAEVTTDEFTADIGGSGSIDVSALSTDTVVVGIGGSGSVTLDGDGDELDLSIGGSGSFDGERLEVDVADIHIGGSGSATVNVAETLDVSIVGSGSVEYLGTPDLTVDRTGSGDVVRR